ncbi:MAG: hypoxanthine phosphoribosyltransferase [Nitrospirota bacterium]
MDRIYGKPIITKEEIQKRVKELGRKIAMDYRAKDLLLICVLKGAFIFFSDLSRAIRLPLRTDFIIASSYKKTKSSGKVSIIADISEDINGQDVLLVDDIVDSGLTLDYLTKYILTKGPRSLKACILLDKSERRQTDITIDYTGFNIPNKFVVGYGLDYQNKYRNLPYIAVLDVINEDII